MFEVKNLLVQLDGLDKKGLNILGIMLQTLRGSDEFFPFTKECKLYHSQDWERSDFLHYFNEVERKVQEVQSQPVDPKQIALRGYDLAVECSIIMSTILMAKLDEQYLSEHNEIV